MYRSAYPPDLAYAFLDDLDWYAGQSRPNRPRQFFSTGLILDQRKSLDKIFRLVLICVREANVHNTQGEPVHSRVS